MLLPIWCSHKDEQPFLDSCWFDARDLPACVDAWPSGPMLDEAAPLNAPEAFAVGPRALEERARVKADRRKRPRAWFMGSRVEEEAAARDKELEAREYTPTREGPGYLVTAKWGGDSWGGCISCLDEMGNQAEIDLGNLGDSVFDAGCKISEVAYWYERGGIFAVLALKERLKKMSGGK